MKKAINTLLFFTVLVLLSNCYTEGEIQEKGIPTKVKGNVSDVERGKPVADFKIVLIRWWCGSTNWDLYGCDHEVIDSARTDKNGNYAIQFDFMPDQNYGFLHGSMYYQSPYFVDFIENSDPIVAGEEYVQNIDAWLPVILKLNLHIINNDHPNLGVNVYLPFPNTSNLGGASIAEQAIDTTVYFKAKPNSEMEIVFHYTTGYSNSEAFKKYEFITTTLQDTLELSYDIDCSSFEPLANY